MHGGRWLVRIEDVDRAREVPGAADRILRTLEACGLRWDGAVERQSGRGDRYAAALESLRDRGLVYECSCSRRDLGEERYPGHCRSGSRRGGPTASRLRVAAGAVAFTDRLQGSFQQDVAAAVGDPILKRRDGFYAYLLAVVVDDAAQGVTQVVRGADLLDDTPRQIVLQRCLGLPTPGYAHVPVLVEPDGSKLAKSARAAPVYRTDARIALRRVLQLLSLTPPTALWNATVEDLWAWAGENCTLEAVSGRLTLSAEA